MTDEALAHVILHRLEVRRTDLEEEVDFSSRYAEPVHKKSGLDGIEEAIEIVEQTLEEHKENGGA